MTNQIPNHLVDFVKYYHDFKMTYITAQYSSFVTSN